MSDNIVQAVASGDAPQPNEGVESNYDETLDAAEDAVDGSEALESSPEAAIDDAQKNGDISKAQAQELKKKLRLKIDGVEEDFEVPSDEEELKKHFQKSKAFDKRLKEFSGFKSQVDSLLEQLKSDPESVLEKLGYNVDEMAEKRLSKKIEEMKKSPDQLKQEQMEKELSDLRKEKKKIEEERSKSELERMRNEQAQSIEHDISTALDNSNSILPKRNPKVLARVAQTMLLAMQNGYEAVTAKDVIPLVEKEWRNELREAMDGSTEDMLEELVGKANMDRYRKKKMGTRKATVTANQIARDTGAKKSAEMVTDNKPKKRMKDVFSWND